jgi:hypothetical protein
MQLRVTFGGAVLLLFGLGIGVCLALLRTLPRDMARQKAIMQARISGL